jgi:hypothetical protein
MPRRQRAYSVRAMPLVRALPPQSTGPKAAPRAEPTGKEAHLRRGIATASHPAAKPNTTQGFCFRLLRRLGFFLARLFVQSRYFPRPASCLQSRQLLRDAVILCPILCSLRFVAYYGRKSSLPPGKPENSDSDTTCAQFTMRTPSIELLSVGRTLATGSDFRSISRH